MFALSAAKKGVWAAVFLFPLPQMLLIDGELRKTVK